MRGLDIVGGGAVGRTLGRLVQRAGAARIGRVTTQGLAGAHRAVEFIGAGEAGVGAALSGPLDLVMLSVGDDAIAATAEALAGSGAELAGAVAFHCSGALDADVLAALRERGACVGSLHPVKTFADPEAAASGFAGTHCGLEGDAEAVEALRALVLAIGGVPFEIASAHKALYHAGSVFACNYLTALLEVAQRLHERAGLSRDTSSALLEPLVRETVRNVFALGPAGALTGPIARGDAALVARQLDALGAADGDLRGLYAALGSVALELARARVEADPHALDALERVLEAARDEARRRP